MTATVDILQDMARGAGPARSLLALGYAGWGPGQLEGEIQANGWLTAPADAELVFGLARQREVGRRAPLDLHRPAAPLRRGAAGAWRTADRQNSGSGPTFSPEPDRVVVLEPGHPRGRRHVGVAEEAVLHAAGDGEARRRSCSSRRW